MHSFHIVSEDDGFVRDGLIRGKWEGRRVILGY